MRVFRKTDYLSGVSVRKTAKNRKSSLHTLFGRWYSIIKLHPRVSRGVVYGIGVLFFALVFTNSQPAHAAVLPPPGAGTGSIASNMSPSDEAYSYEYYQAISWCMGKGALADDSWALAFGDRINVPNAQSGIWFKSSGASTNGPMGIYLGSANIKTDDKGSINCNDPNLVPNALALWDNWPYDQALCSSGFERVASDQRSRCLASQGGTDNFQKATNNIQGAFDTAVKGRVYGGSAPTLSGLAQYDLYLGTFQATCIKGATTLSAKPSGSTNKDYEVIETTGTGAGATTRTVWYVGSASSSYTRSTSVQYSSKSSDTMTCAQLASAISQLAPAYTQYLKQGGDDSTPDAQSNSDSSTATSCAIPNAFSWAICGVGTLFADLTDGFYQFIASFFLATNPSIVSASGGTHDAWLAVLSLANIIFVIVFLVIIFSQATGYGISNYGIKKMLPRLIIGVILINLSFFLCQVAVDLSNVFGYGISTLFKNAAPPPTWHDLMKDILVTQFTGVAAGAAILAGVVAFTTGIGIAGVLVCLLVLVFIALFLIARQVLIILCIVIAPIAFAAWLLPNTERFFKQWWKVFFAMLIVFPLASLVVGASNLAASVIANTFSQTGSSNALISAATVPQKTIAGGIIGAIVQMLPLILIPLLLKGLLDAVPVIGKFAQSAMKRSTSGANKWAKDDASFFGRRRAEYNNNRRGLFGKPVQPGDKTLGNRWQSYRNARQEQVKSIQQAGHEEERARLLDSDDTSWSTRIARTAHHEGENTDALKGQNDQGFKTQLAARRVTDEELRRMDQQTQASALGERNENIIRQGKFAEALKNNDDGLLDVAAGKLDTERGRTMALGAATSVSYKEFDENVANQTNLLTDKMQEIEKEGAKDADELNEDGSFKLDQSGNRIVKRFSGAEMAQRYVSSQLRSGNVYEVAAARNKMFSMGASGVNRWVREWTALQDSGHFDKVNNFKQDDGTIITTDADKMRALKVDIQNNTKNDGSLASQLKKVDKMAMNAVAQGIDITPFRADKGKAVVVGMNDKDVGEASTPFLLQAIANGSYSSQRASGVLTNDVARNDYTQEQLQILQVLKDGGDDPNDLVTIPARNPDGTYKRDPTTNEIITKKATRGQAAVEAIWNTNDGRLRKVRKPNNPTEETSDTIDLSLVVAPGKAVPGPGSPVKVIQDYVDKYNGLDRLSRDDFTHLQLAVSTSVTPSDNEDLQKLRAQVEAEVARRNEAVRKVNAAAGAEVFIPVRNTPPSETPPAGNPAPAPSAPAPAPAPAPSVGYRQNISLDELKKRIEETRRVYSVSLADLEVTQLELDTLSQEVRDRVNAVLQAYNEAQISAAESGRGSDQVIAGLKEGLKKDIARVMDGK